MTEAERRVVVAKDALEQIRVGKYKPRLGHYVHLKERITETEPSRFQRFIKNQKSCSVCQIGSLFLSSVRVENNVSGKSFEYATLLWPSEEADGCEFRKTLNRLFTQEQLGLMECAFEQRQCGDFGSPKNLDAELAYRAINKFKGKKRDERIVGVLKNIIRNKGTFVV